MKVTELEQNVHQLEFDDGKVVFIVGTAHVSQSSIDLTDRIIRQYQPDVVAVELCEPRFKSLEDPDRWKNTDIVTVIREGRSNVLLAQLALSAFQRKIGKQLNVKPGAEMLKGVQLARELGTKVELIDRGVSITLKRVWSGLGLWGSIKLIWSLVFMISGAHKVDADEIERLKSSDVMSEVMRDFTKALPEVRTALIDERDQYLAGMLKRSDGRRIVAVVGAAHVPGILKVIDAPIDLERLNQLPKKGITGKLIGLGFPAAIIGVMIYAFFSMDSSVSGEMVWTWFLVTGIAGALGSALALAHPLSILSAFFGSGFAALHPLIAAGWISGLVEALIRKPRVRDFENIADDIETLRGLFSNRVTRILLIVAFTNLAVMAGMALGIGKIVELLANH